MQTMRQNAGITPLHAAHSKSVWLGVLIVLVLLLLLVSTLFGFNPSSNLAAAEVRTPAEPHPFGPGWAADYGTDSKLSDSFCSPGGRCYFRTSPP